MNMHADKPSFDSKYAWYVLGVLCLVYMFNQMDRFILSILAEDIKARFDASDSQIGFLTGTAFAVFYALFGYPIARLADRWSRVNMLAIGLTLWSACTALSGLAGSFGQLTALRIGVGIGEATASPVGFSLISDWFSRAKRATAFGIFSSGLNLGTGLSLLLGGLIAARWDAAYPLGQPFSFEGWQVAFIAFGVPGILLAVWVITLREPVRGQSDGVSHEVKDRIWHGFRDDLFGILPPLTFFDAARRGRRAFAINVTAAIVSALFTWMLGELTGDWLQWITIGFGYYAAFSASQSLRHHDRPTFALTWGTPTFVLAMVGFGAATMVLVIIGFWMAPLAVRHFAIDRGTVGLVLGLVTALGGSVGMIGGGIVSDALFRKSARGRIWFALGCVSIPIPFILIMCVTDSSTVFFASYIPVALIAPAWVGAAAATIQDLVLPRMRATATNVYLLVATLAGTGLGPYLVGKVSVTTGSLALGIGALSLTGGVVAAGSLWWCARTLQHAEESKTARALASAETS